MRKERDKKEEVEYKNKSGTAWSHSYLNQKPWHPLSYPNQRRKWIAEQTHAEHQRKSEEVAREFSQEQDFFRTSSMLSKKEREKLEVMQAVSFMYMRPPGYNAESARAAEIAEEKKVADDDNFDEKAAPVEEIGVGAKKRRVKDLYGRTIPTEEEFPVLKNAPRLESGAAGRVKPFAVEIRNVKCARCGAFGHQSGDRECPLKDSISTIDEARQKRDDPLTSIISAVSEEPLKWEIKHKPGGLSPPRGGFRKDDPNQQIIPEDIYDEYGGFLAGGGEVQDLLASLPKIKKHKRKKLKKHKVGNSSSESSSESDSEREHQRRRRKLKEKKKLKEASSESGSGSDAEHGRRRRRKHKEKKKRKESSSESDSGSDRERDRRHRRNKDHKGKRRREKEGKESKESKRGY